MWKINSAEAGRGKSKKSPSFILLTKHPKCTLLELKPSLYSENSGQTTNTGVYPKVSELAAWSKNCKWYSSVPLGAVMSLLCESSEFCRHNPLCCFSTSNTKGKRVFHYRLSPRTSRYTAVDRLKFVLHYVNMITESDL
jgi:hypothetical protein